MNEHCYSETKTACEDQDSPELWADRRRIGGAYDLLFRGIAAFNFFLACDDGGCLGYKQDHVLSTFLVGL